MTMLQRMNRVFPRRLTNRRFLTIGYCLRTIGYCFSYCFLKIFVRGQGLDGGSPHKGNPNECAQ